MKIHLTTSAGGFEAYEALKGHPYTLLSFVYRSLEPRYTEGFTSDHEEIILDSGAFSAWNAGKTIDISTYAQWAVKFTCRHADKLTRIRYINLDVIPGEAGRTATPDELKQAAADSVRNVQVLRSTGYEISEVFHQGEPAHLLDEIVERAEGGLICISPRNDVSVARRQVWLGKVAQHCLKRYGAEHMPKAHGLAVTSERLLESYPFYSADSSTWASCLRFGGAPSLSKNLPRAANQNSTDAFLYALKQEVKRYQKMQNDMTNLWTHRGIVWDD